MWYELVSFLAGILALVGIPAAIVGLGYFLDEVWDKDKGSGDQV